VTGANGFMGSRIVRELLAGGYRVAALTDADLGARNPASLDLEVRPLELLDSASVRAALAVGELLVRDAACYSFWQGDPRHICGVNVEGTRGCSRPRPRAPTTASIRFATWAKKGW
jgi:nucleoside-diphosphate-sugar epimerase